MRVDHGVKVVVLLVAAALSANAHADRATFASAGIGLGTAFAPESCDGGDCDEGFVLGVETSVGVLVEWSRGDEEQRMQDLFDLDKLIWFGGYVDVARDFGADATRASLGPEIGRGVAGIDTGIVLERGDATRWGWRVRPALAMAAVSFYVGYTRFSSGTDRNLIDVGVLLKWPHVFDD